MHPMIASVRKLASTAVHLSRCARASQIAEFAIGLPFLMVLLVGIFDFGQVLNTKQKINNGAREVARYASNQSTLDLSQTDPPSIEAAKLVMANYLTANHIDNCALDTAVARPVGNEAWAWHFTSRGECVQILTLKIERAYQYGDNGDTVISTKVTITYPLEWHFAGVMRVLLPRSRYRRVVTITTDAVMANMT